jgi:hypothetical protein
VTYHNYVKRLGRNPPFPDSHEQNQHTID